jgi:hypothetical protein
MLSGHSKGVPLPEDFEYRLMPHMGNNPKTSLRSDKAMLSLFCPLGHWLAFDPKKASGYYFFV